MDKMSGVLLTDLMHDNIKLEEVFNDVKLGEVMKSVHCDGTSCDIAHTHEEGWYKKNATTDVYEKCDVLMQRISDQELGTLMNGGMDLATVFNGVKLGEVLKYTYDAENKYWTKTDADGTTVKKVGAIEGVVADIELSKMLNGSIDLSTQFDDIYLGELMGYAPVKDTAGNIVKWEKDGVQLTDEVLLCVVGFKFSEVKGGDFAANLTEKIKNGVHLGTIMELNGPLSILKDTHNPDDKGPLIKDISTTLEDKIKTTSAGELQKAGILPLSDDTMDKMDMSYGFIAIQETGAKFDAGKNDGKAYAAAQKYVDEHSAYSSVDQLYTKTVTALGTTYTPINEDVRKGVGRNYWTSLQAEELINVLVNALNAIN